MKLFLAAVVALFALAAGQDDDFEDLQTEFFLPYSETEDVDFSIVRPGGSGCFQWSTNNTEVIRLDPVNTDYDRMCGFKLEFQILPGKCAGADDTVIQIVAENIDMDGYENDSPAVIEYTVHVKPLATMEVLGLKTELTAGSDPVPFGIAGYDSDDNEFDTLDGLQIAWYMGSKREIAVFEKHRQVGPIVKLQPLRAGNGAVMALVNDPNYEDIEPAILEFSISAPLSIEPDGVFILEGASATFKLMESGVDKEGVVSVSELNVTAEDSDYKFEIKDADIGEWDPKTSTVTALAEGETTLFVKNNEGEVVKFAPIRITTAHSLKVESYPDPESNQLILGHDYDIKLKITNKDGMEIYPSPNILCKTTFPKQFDIVEVSENGLSAKIRAISVGLGKIKGSLRSVLTEDDEEIEIVPHVKGATDFEVYESVVIKPRETILPWDETTKPVYTLSYGATGGGKVYTWSTDNEDLATADSEGKVTTHSGPGTFTVRAAMVKGSQNFDEAKVYVLPVTHLEFKDAHVETATHTALTLALRMKTFLHEDDEPVMFTDCADVPFKILLSDNKNFEVDRTYERGNNRVYDACASFTVKANTPGTTCKVTVQYTEPSTGRQLKATTHISAYGGLDVLHPFRNDKNGGYNANLLLPVGGQTNAVFKGGPTPWMSKPSAHFKQVEVEDPTIIRVSKIEDSDIAAPVIAGTYMDVAAYTVTCLKEGETLFSYMVGNTASSTNKNPIQTIRDVRVKCDVPAKVVVKAEPRKNGEADADLVYGVNPKNSNLLVHNDKDILLHLTVKNSEGKSFNDVSSLKFDVKISDDSLVKKTGPKVEIPSELVAEAAGVLTVPGKARLSLTPKATAGELEVIAYLAGYDENVLKERNVQITKPLPEVKFDDDEDEDEDEDFSAHHHSLSDTLDLELATKSVIDATKKN